VRAEYGESVAAAEARNLRTQVARQYDEAGVTANDAFDFKGNLLDTRLRLAAEYREVVDWAADVPLDDRSYRSETAYDALDRPVSLTTPDRSELRPSYNPASLLDRLDGRLHGRAEATTFVEHLEYNARGQRTRIDYGNGSSSTYHYDELTFRLIRLATRRDGRRLQDLRYTYDPVGNPTLVRDHARQRIFFRNQVVDPSSAYTYDALYRLIKATGREHLGQVSGEPQHPVPSSATDAPRVGLPQPGDGAAMARYIERYVYDEAGNLLRMAHRSTDPAHGGWTRDYHYREPSLLEPARHSNRLTGTRPAGTITAPQRFSYDEQGNITAMPEIPVLRWNQNDQLQATARRAGGRESTYYTYDASGQRARKVTEHASHRTRAVIKSETIYVGAFEVYREYGTDGGLTLERETLNVFDDRQRVALVETRTAGTDRGPRELIRYQLANHLGSCVLELDQHAQVITYEEYYPYGSTSYQAVRSGTETPKRYRFTGKERDTETGLYYHGARYYAPWLGRWTSCDPAGLVDSMNLYQYALCNPVRFADSSGMWVDPDLFIDNPDADPAVIGGGLQFKTEDGRFATIHDEPLTFEDPGQPAPPPEAKKQPPPKPPAKATPEKPKPTPATHEEAVAAFSKGAFWGLLTGGAVDFGVGLAAGLTGVAAGSIGLFLGAALLPIAAYEVVTHWDDIKAGADRLLSRQGTSEDYETAGNVFGGLLSIPFAGGLSELGTQTGKGVRTAGNEFLTAGKEFLKGLTQISGPELATAGGGPTLSGLDEPPVLMTTGGGAGGRGVTSVIKNDSFLAKAAEETGANQRVQLEMDTLQEQLAAGNMNPGIGTKSLAGTGISYARGANGARLFFRNVAGGIQIVAKASKANESRVINRLMQLYGR